MLEQYFENHIKVMDTVANWEEAINHAAKILVEKEYIEASYVNAMIENIHKNGSYIIILPKLALPHARPDGNVYKTTLSMLKLNQSVTFPDDKEVQLIIVLAAIDSDVHLEIISELSEILIDADKVKQLMTATSDKQLEAIIQSVQ